MAVALYSRRRSIALLVAALAVSLGVALPAVGANERDTLSNELSSNKAEAEKLQSQLEGVDVSLQQTYLDLEATRAAIPAAAEALAGAERTLAGAAQVQQMIADRLAVAENELVVLAGDIEASQALIAESEASLGALARATYQNGGMATQNPITMLFGTQSTDDFLTQYVALDSAVRSQTAILSEVAELEAEQRNAEARQESVLQRIADLKAEADRAVAEADAARQVAADKRSELAGLEQSQAVLAADLESQKGALEEQQAKIAADNAELQRRIAAIDEANRRAGAGSGPVQPSGSIIPPVPSPVYVTSPYGYRIYPITGGWFMHYGVDLRSACGNRQSAVAAGTVTDVRGAYGNGTHGNQVIINHGIIDGASYVSVYNHLSSFAVSAGQRVSQGQAIGNTGATGNVTGCHVHLEIWQNGKTIDPMTLPAF